ncbi:MULTISPECIES: hypothetical protein [Thalassospira]|uniref:hypothetical protein n=2 Tax=Thalassospira TaxID=168934 RepID=UPI001587588E|nr:MULTISPECIES: hypothetical protein [Thalassospira]MDM7975867.1 hypothetical protein [Thalassospira xiamenensis]
MIASVWSLGGGTMSFYKSTPTSISEVMARFAAVKREPIAVRRPTRSNINRVIQATMNGPFPNILTSDGLVSIIRQQTIPDRYVGHLQRFAGELSKSLIQSFITHHGISINEWQDFLKANTNVLHLSDQVLRNLLDDKISDNESVGGQSATKRAT